MSFWTQIKTVAEKLDQTNYYELLGVQQDAQGQDIINRYYQLAAKLHPDKFATADSEATHLLSRIHARLTEAKTILEVPATRKLYDALLIEGQCRFQEENKKALKSYQAPTHPMAQKCFEEGMRLKRQGEKDAARKQLLMAKRYQEHQAIDNAIASLEDNKTDKKLKHQSPFDSGLDAFLGAHDKKDAIEAEDTNDDKKNENTTSATKKPSNAQSLNDREYQRVRAALPVQLTVKNQKQLEIFYTKNISRGGVFIASDQPKPVGTPVDITVVAPNGQSLVFPGAVAHVRKEEQGRAAGMGVKFDDTQKNKDMVAKLLKDINSINSDTISLEELVATLITKRDGTAHHVLGIELGASMAEAEDAYALLIQKYHPISQTQDDPMIANASKELLQIIQKAFENYTR